MSAPPLSQVAIAGSDIHTAAFIGVAVPGQTQLRPPLPLPLPSIRPVLVESWAEFETRFGGVFAQQPDVSSDDSEAHVQFAASVHGFFLNGGKRAWIVPLKSARAFRQLDGGLNALKAIREISFVAAPGIEDPAVRAAVVRHCETMKHRIAILDGVRSPPDADRDAYAGGVSNSGRTVVLYPWLKKQYPRVGSKYVAVPPSGPFIGLVTRADLAHGIRNSPASESLSADFDLHHSLTESERHQLLGWNINVPPVAQASARYYTVRTFVDPYETGASGSLFVRRLINFIERSIVEETPWVLTAPNTPQTWGRLSIAIRSFLVSQWSLGNLAGSTMNHAFFVECSSKNQTQADLAESRTVADVGISLLKPAEFFVFRIKYERNGASGPVISVIDLR